MSNAEQDQAEPDALRDFGDFAGRIHAGPDYAERVDEILSEGFGRS